MVTAEAHQAALDRMKELEVGLRRAIHLIETTRGYVMWPMDGEAPEDIYTEEWASLTLELCKDALAGESDD